jgi:hypothetical protein
MSKPPITQLDIFGELRHIEMAIAREVGLLTPYERKEALHDLLQARELIRDAGAKLTRIRDARRSKRNGR